MSHIPNSDNRIPTNEEVIEEITRDLNNQNLDSSNEYVKSENSIPADVPVDSNTLPIPQDFEESLDEDDEKKSPEEDPFNDYVDEEELKLTDDKLTDEEKESRRKEALELKTKANATHKKGDFLEAVGNYTQALRQCPLKYQDERAVLYCNRAASKIQLNYKKPALDDCSKAVELNPNYVRAYLRRAKLHEELDKLDESLEDYKKVLEFDPGNPEALKANARLPPLIAERNEKLKTEVLGKLKDLGNLFLRPFGLSTDNFNLQQDPNTGGYSVNFQQKN